jgi:hypothetical protein
MDTLNPLGHIEIWDVEAKLGSGRMKESCREVAVEAEHGQALAMGTEDLEALIPEKSRGRERVGTLPHDAGHQLYGCVVKPTRFYAVVLLEGLLEEFNFGLLFPIGGCTDS